MDKNNETKVDLAIGVQGQKKAGSVDNTPYLNAVRNLISVFPQRSQEIIKMRYGLADETGETLEKIGHDYGITRERVRQIIADVIRNIVKGNSGTDFSRLEEKLIFVIEKNNGIIEERDIVKKLNSDGFLESNAIRFIAQCSKKITAFEKKGVIVKSWVTGQEAVSSAEKVFEVVSAILAEKKMPMDQEEISAKIAEKMSGLTEAKALKYLGVLTAVKKNKFGKWGMADWKEISPKGAREKIYLILKETKAPLHFRDIARLIDKHALGNRKAHPQTIHNELIKDRRFVLIGRGIYALREWGYSEGTIKDVIRRILAERDRPMDKEEILSEVLKIRKVKKATIMINLNNSRLFERNNDLYTIKK